MTCYRYLFLKILKNFLAALILINAIFVINYVATHLELSGQNQLDTIFIKGLRLSLSNIYIITPLSLLISSLWVYLSLQVRLELCAFMTQGISYFALLKPLIHMTCLLFLIMWSFYIGFDAQNEAYIAENSVKKSKDLRVEIYALEDNQILICTNQNHYPAYFEDRFGKIYYTEDFDLTKDYFLAEKLLCTQDTLELQLLEQKPSFLIRYLPEVFLDPSKPLQIFLIGLIPLLVLKDAFKFSRMTKPLLILAKNSTLFVILNLVGKSLCHLISKII